MPKRYTNSKLTNSNNKLKRRIRTNKNSRTPAEEKLKQHKRNCRNFKRRNRKLWHCGRKGGSNYYDSYGEQLFFSRGDIDVSKGGKDILERVGSVLAKLEDKVIWVEGHSDDDPIVSPSLKRKYKTNWELSAARATNVVRFFQEQCKIDPLKLIAAGMGQYRPRYSNEDRATKAKNRRIEISILMQCLKKNKGKIKKNPKKTKYN